VILRKNHRIVPMPFHVPVRIQQEADILAVSTVTPSLRLGSPPHHGGLHQPLVPRRLPKVVVPTTLAVLRMSPAACLPILHLRETTIPTMVMKMTTGKTLKSLRLHLREMMTPIPTTVMVMMVMMILPTTPTTTATRPWARQ